MIPRQGSRSGWRRGVLRRQMLRAQQLTRMIKMTRRFWLPNSRSSRRRGPSRFSLQRGGRRTLTCRPTHIHSLFLFLQWRTWVVFRPRKWVPSSNLYMSQMSRQHTCKQCNLDHLKRSMATRWVWWRTWVLTVGSGIVIILLCVTNIMSNKHLTIAT